jgi:hypothetical protein
MLRCGVRSAVNLRRISDLKPLLKGVLMRIKLMTAFVTAVIFALSITVLAEVVETLWLAMVVIATMLLSSMACWQLGWEAK